MVTEQEYLQAKRVVNTYLDAQPTDPKYPYKPKRMNMTDYMRQRALNEILRLFDDTTTITFEDFLFVLSQFNLEVYQGTGDKKEKYKFVELRNEMKPVFPPKNEES